MGHQDTRGLYYSEMPESSAPLKLAPGRIYPASHLPTQASPPGAVDPCTVCSCLKFVALLQSITAILHDKPRFLRFLQRDTATITMAGLQVAQLHTNNADIIVTGTASQSQ